MSFFESLLRKVSSDPEQCRQTGQHADSDPDLTPGSGWDPTELRRELSPADGSEVVYSRYGGREGTNWTEEEEPDQKEGLRGFCSQILDKKLKMILRSATSDPLNTNRLKNAHSVSALLPVFCSTCSFHGDTCPTLLAAS